MEATTATRRRASEFDDDLKGGLVVIKAKQAVLPGGLVNGPLYVTFDQTTGTIKHLSNSLPNCSHCLTVSDCGEGCRSHLGGGGRLWLTWWVHCNDASWRQI